MDCPTNSSDCVSTQEEDNFSLGTAGTIEVAILLCIFLIGGPLNVLSLKKSVKAFRHHNAKSQILLLRINLNIADLITLFIYVPRQIIWMLTFQWYGGEALCRINSFFSTFSFYLNSFVIACIAIDRVFGAYNISSINAHRRAYKRCRNLLTIGWMLAFLLSIPQSFVFRILSPFPDFSQCVPLWHVVAYESFPLLNNESIAIDFREKIHENLVFTKRIEHWYNIAHLLFVFWIPCVIIVISYLTVLIILQGHLKEEPSTSMIVRCCFGESHKLEPHEDFPSPVVSSMAHNDESSVMIKMKEEQSYCDFKTMLPVVKQKSPRLGAMAVTTIHKAKQHAKRQAAWIILAYLSFWSPYNFIAVFNILNPGYNLPFPHSFLNALICANSIVNPIIYGVFQKNKR